MPARRGRTPLPRDQHTTDAQGPKPRDRTHRPYIAVLTAVLLGIVVGFVLPDFAVGLTWTGTAFVALIKMPIAPLVLRTIVLGIGAIQAMGRSGEPILRAVGYFQQLVFRVLAMIMWVAPIGAFGAIAAVVGQTGWDALKTLAVIMFGFYPTCVLFVVVVLGLLLFMISASKGAAGVTGAGLATLATVLVAA